MSKTNGSTLKVKIPIGFKLISVTALMLIASTFTVVFLATTFFSADITAFIQRSSADVASQFANQTFDYLEHVKNALHTMAEIQGQKLDKNHKENLLLDQFSKNRGIVSVASWKRDDASANYVITSPGGQAYKGAAEKIKPSIKVWGDAKSNQDMTDVQRVSFNGQGFLAFSFPSEQIHGKVTKAIVGILNLSKFTEIFGKSGDVTSFLVDKEGNVLAGPDKKLVEVGASLKRVPIVKAMLETTDSKPHQTRFINTDDKAYLGSYKLVGIGGIGVTSQVLEEKALATVRKVKRVSAEVAGVILFLFFGAIYFFSATLTGPIKTLVGLTREIASGNFKIKITPKGHDEITELTKSFGKMAEGLAERDKLKETFNKFHSKEIADAILSGEIKLGGNRQKATVFFSDIRSFTSLSEELEAEQVVEMLNEYMTAMVSEITAHHGVVDKYVGDAIMAVWGVPMAKPGDAWNAVRASLAMRVRLEKFNQERISQKKKPICIGMGLHTGELIAGNIGSTEKMEYTVIGDTVNTASRIESLTKEFGTDLLISDDVYAQVKDKVLVEPVSANVKGKAKAVTAYKVKGYYDEAGKPVIIETAYSSYEAGHSDKVVHKDKAA